MTSTRLKAILLSLYFDYGKLIFFGIWFGSWLFFIQHESFFFSLGQSLAYALFISVGLFLFFIPAGFAILIAGFGAYEVWQGRATSSINPK